MIPLFDRLAAGDTSAAEEIVKHSMERLKRLTPRIRAELQGHVQVDPDPAQATSQAGNVFDRPAPHAETRERKREQLQEIDEQVETSSKTSVRCS